MRHNRTAALAIAALTLAPLSWGEAHADVSETVTGRIVFIRAGDVHIADARGTQVRRLTATTAVESTPVWSPDGSKIAFVRGDWIWTVPSSGGTAVRRLGGTSPSWSPDGRHLAYSRVERDSGYEENGQWVDCLDYPVVSVATASGQWVRDVDGSNAGTACRDFSFYWETYGPSTSWSPDGLRVLYGAHITGEAEFEGLQATDIQEADAHTDGHGHRLQTWRSDETARPHRTPEVDYAPTGTHYAYATNARSIDRSGRLWVTNRTGTSTQQASPDRDTRHPAYSPTGTHLLYTQQTPGQPPSLRRVKLPRSTPVTILTNASQADWQ